MADLEEDPLELRLGVSQLERELHLGVVARVADDLLDRVLVLRLGKLVSVEQTDDQFAVFKFKPETVDVPETGCWRHLWYRDGTGTAGRLRVKRGGFHDLGRRRHRRLAGGRRGRRRLPQRDVLGELLGERLGGRPEKNAFLVCLISLEPQLNFPLLHARTSRRHCGSATSRRTPAPGW